MLTKWLTQNIKNFVMLLLKILEPVIELYWPLDLSLQVLCGIVLEPKPVPAPVPAPVPVLVPVPVHVSVPAPAPVPVVEPLYMYLYL